MTDVSNVQQATLVVEKFDSYVELLIKKQIVSGINEAGPGGEHTYFIGCVIHLNDMFISNWFNFDFVKEASDLLEYKAQKYRPFLCHLLYITRSYLSDENCDITKLRSCVYRAIKLSIEQSKSAPIIDTKVLDYRSMPDTELNQLLSSNVFLILMTVLLNFHATSTMETTELLLNNNPTNSK